MSPWIKQAYVPLGTLLVTCGLAAFLIAQEHRYGKSMDLQHARLFDANDLSALVSKTSLSPREQESLKKTALSPETRGQRGAPLLFMGNSQTMRIMDYRPGDLTTPQWLQVFLDRQAEGKEHALIDVYNLAVPNISQPEVLIRMLACQKNLKNGARVMVVQLPIDGMRFLDVRSALLKEAAGHGTWNQAKTLLAKNPDLPKAQRVMEALYLKSKEHGTSTGSQSKDSGAYSQLKQTIDHGVEKLPLFNNREKVRWFLGMWFHIARDKALGFKSESARPLLRPAYESNLELIELIMRYAKEHQIALFYYLAPIRPIEPNPALPSDVVMWRRDLKQLASKYGMGCLDYTGLVPDPLWTNYTATDPGGVQRDFAHFTGEANKLVANNLAKDLARFQRSLDKNGQRLSSNIGVISRLH